MFAALSFTACGGDDEEDGGSIPSPLSSMVIRINGVDWAASAENPPLFYGHFDGSNSAGLIFTKFTRKETTEMHHPWGGCKLYLCNLLLYKYPLKTAEI